MLAWQMCSFPFPIYPYIFSYAQLWLHTLLSSLISYHCHIIFFFFSSQNGINAKLVFSWLMSWSVGWLVKFTLFSYYPRAQSTFVFNPILSLLHLLIRWLGKKTAWWPGMDPTAFSLLPQEVIWSRKIEEWSSREEGNKGKSRQFGTVYLLLHH